MAKPHWAQGDVQELPPGQVFKDYAQDVGLTKDGHATKNPWAAGYDRLPDEIMKAPVQFWIYNVSPMQRWICMGGLGTKFLRPCPEGEKYGPHPLPVKRYEVDWADLGEYKHKAVIIEGKDMVREMVVPGGEAENDLRRWGVFYSEHNPPLEEELKAANAQLERTFDAIVKQGDQLYEQRRFREITPIFQTASKWMKAPRPWCAISKQMEECPGCMKPVDKGAAKHECGAILDWKKARQLRLVTKEEYLEAVEDGLVPGEKPAPKQEPYRPK